MRGRSSFMKEAKAARIKDFEAHSPMFKNRHFNEERRSKLFSDRPFIWGRFPKYIIAFALSMNFWAGYYIYHRHTLTM